MTGTPSRSAWNCMSRSLATMPPSTFSEVRSTPESWFMASTTSRLWNAVASSVGLPVRREQARERRHDVAAAVVLDRAREVLDLRRGLDHLQVVAQPLDERAGDRDRALEAVHRLLVAEPVRDRREQPGARRHRLRADVHEQEVADAVAVLGLAGRE